MTTSRIPGFYQLSRQERLAILDKMYSFNDEEWRGLQAEGALSHDTTEKLIENAIGQYALPIGVAPNFRINQKDYVVPMVIEEPSVIASASHIAKIVRESDGFAATATDRMMIGQIQVMDCADFESARRTLLRQEDMLVKAANEAQPGMKERGGGARRIEVRQLDAGTGRDRDHTLVVHLLIDTCDAMGANTINTMVEAIAPLVEELSAGKVHLRILSNYTDDCIARASCDIPPSLLTTGEFSGENVRDGIVSAYQFATRDVHRAVTHNKGVMNGVDAVAIATGNDWRAVEAAAHAYTSRFGRYDSMTTWSVAENGHLVGSLELPMPVGTVGGSIGIHPMAQLSQKLLQVESAPELARVIVAVGLAQNLGALKALATDGIQKGHMALQSRSVALSAGARGDQVDEIARQLTESNDFSLEKARVLLESMQ